MPLTAAERSKRYREKVKLADPDKYNSMKDRALARAKRSREVRLADPEKRQILLKKWRQEQKPKESAQPDKNSGAGSSRDSQNADCANCASLSIERNIQRRVERKLLMHINKLQKGYNSLLEKMRIQDKKFKKMDKSIEIIMQKLQDSPKAAAKDITICQAAEYTPQKRSECFINEHLPTAETPVKETVKKVLLEHNVLSDALKEKFESSSNQQKNLFKSVINSPTVKKYKVKGKLTKKLGLKTNLKKYEMQRKKTITLRDKLAAFFEQDDVSRATAGKKEYVRFKKCIMQKRYLLDSLKNLHEKYVNEKGPISYTTFRKYRPFYVVAPRLKDLETCICMKHANMTFMTKALASSGVIQTKSVTNVIRKQVCDIQFKNCMYGTCEACSENIIKDDDENEKTTTWLKFSLKDHEYTDKNNQLKTTKKTTRTEESGKVTDLIQIYNAKMKQFKIHVFNVAHQYQQYKACISNLTENDVLIHIDFSENWVCKSHQEVQAMHFGASKNQITLHTGVYYTKGSEKPFSFCSISANNVHSPEAIWAHLHPVLCHIKLNHPSVDTIHFFSDGPTSQYRQKKNFFLFSDLLLDYQFIHATWNFFEASHGKGAADGVGGALKRTLDFKVAHGTDIPDAETAFDVLNKTETKIKIFYIPSDQIKPLDSNKVAQLKSIPNTMKIHQLVLKDKHLLSHRILSCFCENAKGNCDCFNPKTHKFEIEQINSDMNTLDEVELDECTGNIKKIDRLHETIEEDSETELDLDEPLKNLIETDIKDELNNKSLVEFVEKELQGIVQIQNNESPERNDKVLREKNSNTINSTNITASQIKPNNKSHTKVITKRKKDIDTEEGNKNQCASTSAAKIRKITPKNKSTEKKRTNKYKKKVKVNRKYQDDSSESSNKEIIIDDDSDIDLDEDSEDFCAMCNGYYYDKKGPKVEWIQCIRCHRWLHATCIKNIDICPMCLK